MKAFYIIESLKEVTWFNFEEHFSSVFDISEVKPEKLFWLK